MTKCSTRAALAAFTRLMAPWPSIFFGALKSSASAAPMADTTWGQGMMTLGQCVVISMFMPLCYCSGIRRLAAQGSMGVAWMTHNM